MTRRIGFAVLALLLASPLNAGAQSSTDAGEDAARPQLPEAAVLAEVPIAADAASDALTPSLEGARLAEPIAAPGLFDEPFADLDLMPVQERDKRGLPFMIAGGAAFVAGLIIGDTVGTVIAVGGVAMGVYGIIVYF